MRLSEIIKDLTEWFPPDAHRERTIKGGGNWWFVPWQEIRNRLNQVCPEDWSVQYDEPKYLDQYCYVSCTLIICGVARNAIGNAEIQVLSSTGKDASRGTPIERAVADAFKNAAESFGIAAYLDEQSDLKTKANFAKYMQYHGNSKPFVQVQNEVRAERQNTATPRPAGRTGLVSDKQISRMMAIAKEAGKDMEQVKAVVMSFGFDRRQDITIDKYDAICEKLAEKSDPDSVTVPVEVA